jgi:hypothetical protein
MFLFDSLIALKYSDLRDDVAKKEEMDHRKTKLCCDAVNSEVGLLGVG